MPDLRSFMKILEKEGELHKIDKTISTKYQASAIMKKYDGKETVLFQKLDGYDAHCIAGVCGTKKKLSLALNTTIEKTRPLILDALRNPQKPLENKDFQAKEEVSNLSELPILTHFEKDAGPYITSAIVSAKLPDCDEENVSIHRLMVVDNKHLAIRIVPRHLYQICKIAEEAGMSTLDVGIAIGLHPAVLVAASSPAPFRVSEYAVANKLLNNTLQVSKCRSVDARVPENSEIVIEGKILLDKEIDEGPFVDITGTYDIVRKQPVIRVEKIFCKKGFIYHALLPSGSEHGLLMGFPQEAKIAETVAGVIPKVVDVNLTSGGCHWLHAAISIDKQTEGDAKNVILAAFAGHPSLKHVVVVDPDIDVNNSNDIEWALATRFQGSKGLVIITNVRGSSLDASGDQDLNLTTKVGFDATRSYLKPKEKFERAKIPTEPVE